MLNNLYSKLPQLLVHGVIFFGINQMRVNMSGYDDVYPGGRVQLHDSHLILRTRREEWIKVAEERVGFMMEVIVRKTKIGGTQSASCMVPVRFSSQIDLLSSYIDEAIERKVILAAGPYYDWDGKRYLGKANLRELFADPALLAALKEAVA